MSMDALKMKPGQTAICLDLFAHNPGSSLEEQDKVVKALAWRLAKTERYSLGYGAKPRYRVVLTREAGSSFTYVWMVVG